MNFLSLTSLISLFVYAVIVCSIFFYLLIIIHRKKWWIQAGSIFFLINNWIKIQSLETSALVTQYIGFLIAFYYLCKFINFLWNRNGIPLDEDYPPLKIYKAILSKLGNKKLLNKRTIISIITVGLIALLIALLPQPKSKFEQAVEKNVFLKYFLISDKSLLKSLEKRMKNIKTVQEGLLIGNNFLKEEILPWILQADDEAIINYALARKSFLSTARLENPKLCGMMLKGKENYSNFSSKTLKSIENMSKTLALAFNKGKTSPIYTDLSNAEEVMGKVLTLPSNPFTQEELNVMKNYNSSSDAEVCFVESKLMNNLLELNFQDIIVGTKYLIQLMYNNEESTTQTSYSSHISDKLSSSELDTLRHQLQYCWNIPAKAAHIENLAVDVRVKMGPDGVVQNVEFLNNSRMSQEPLYKALADSVKRTLYHPKCTPLKLPAEKYSLWKEFTITFDPKEFTITFEPAEVAQSK